MQTVQEERIYRDEGTEQNVIELRHIGQALGTPSHLRLARILDDLGHTRWILRAQELGSFGELVEEVNLWAYTVLADALRIAARDGRPHVRADTATHLSFALADISDQLSRDKCAVVRAAVASCHATPAPVLVFLSRDDDELVRYRVASRRELPLSDLRALADKECEPSLIVNVRAQQTLSERA